MKIYQRHAGMDVESTGWGINDANYVIYDNNAKSYNSIRASGPSWSSQDSGK